MKRLLAAACAAMLLTGSLTACSSTKNDTANDTNGTNGTNGANPAGTTYSAPGQVRFPTGADSDRDSYNGMLTNRKYDGTPDGRYTAYSDGTVSPGYHTNDQNTTDLGSAGNNAGSLTGDVARGAGDLVRGTGDAVADIGTGIGNAARDITNW